MTPHARAHPPDRSHPVLRPAPSTEPPYDDELPARHLHLVGTPAEPLPFEEAPPFADPGPRLFEEPLDYFDRQPTPRCALPDPREWLNRLLRVVLECLEGWRPAVQLGRYAVPEVVAVVAKRRKPVGRPGTAPRVRSLHVTEPASGVVESCAVVQSGTRTHAIAIRMEGLDGRWLCVALDVVDRLVTG
jgi:hypothetical protein